MASIGFVIADICLHLIRILAMYQFIYNVTGNSELRAAGHMVQRKTQKKIWIFVIKSSQTLSCTVCWFGGHFAETSTATNDLLAKG